MTSQPTFTRATKQQRRARIFLAGPAGSGKTWTALTWAQTLGERVALIDTEHGTALAYASDFTFDHLDLHPPYTVERYTAAIAAAADARYDVLVIDSTSHAWAGKGGLLELVDEVALRNRNDKFGAGWRTATPKHLEFIEALLTFPGHLICTARAKVDYAVEQDGGRQRVVKLGLAPVQREGLDYEFDLAAEITVPEHILTVTKTRCASLDGFSQAKPDATLAKQLQHWLGDGKPIESEDRPTVAEVLAEARATFGRAELQELHARAERWHLLTSMVTHPETSEELPLNDYLRERWRTAVNPEPAADPS